MGLGVGGEEGRGVGFWPVRFGVEGVRSLGVGEGRILKVSLVAIIEGRIIRTAKERGVRVVGAALVDIQTFHD
jgi:hypothetical protein